MEFCSQEIISGVLFSETSVYEEWAFTLVILTLVTATVFTVSCIFYRPRNSFTQTLKQCFGIDVETDFAANIYIDEDKFLQEQKRRKLSRTLLVVVNGILASVGLLGVITAGLSLLDVKLYDSIDRQVIEIYNKIGIHLFSNIIVLLILPLLNYIFIFYNMWYYFLKMPQFYFIIGIGLSLLFVAYCGIRGVLQSKLSLKLLFYFYFCCFAVIITSYALVVLILFPSTFNIFLDSNWEVGNWFGCCTRNIFLE